jgi:uncharacterized protein (DUF885 family)
MMRAVYPAYQSLKNWLTELLKISSTNNGVWALPDGDEYYAYMLHRRTTTNLLANEIYQLGLQEVERIHKEIKKILIEEIGMDVERPIGTLMQEIAQDPQFYYANTDEGRAACLADFKFILERSRRELAHLFDLKPHAEVAILQVPAYEEEGSSGAYYIAPSIDGSRTGTFFANLRDMREIPKYQMETLAIHEAEPGHHFQFALQYQMDIPILRKLGHYTAYCEGWALYVEKLAYEHGFYSSPFARLGHFQDELLRAVRLVVDTGIHHKRWSREEAIQYMQEMTGYHQNTVTTEVERYFALPGQACAYKIGQLKIFSLRQQAQEALGARFDIREFHNAVLQLGSVPLIVLEEAIGSYINRNMSVSE